jgi:protocatechuate 3,4-dioxygenase beta subunit
MKTRFIIYIILIVLLFEIGCKNNKDKADIDYTVTTYKGLEGSTQILPNATIYFYRSSSDLKLEQNLKSSKSTNENGSYSASEKISNVDNTAEVMNYYFVDAKSNNLNTKRYYKKLGPNYYKDPYQLITNASSGMNGKDKKGNGSLNLYLSSTPTKLRLVVYNSGVPVSDAVVQLYKSEEDYNSNIIDNQPDPDTGVILPNSIYTDSNGEAYFDDLEPKKYWFRISYGSLDNSGGTISTDGALQDNSDITNQLSIGIN